MDHETTPAEQFLADNPDIEVIETLLVDINGVNRGKWVPPEKLPDVLAGDFRLPLTAVASDIWGRDVPALCALTGDGDGICRPDVRTLTRLPWLERPTAQLYLELTHEGAPWAWDPRAVLAGLQARFERLGLTPVVAPELEFMLLDTERRPDGAPQLPVTPFNGQTPVGGQLFSTDLMQEFAAVLHEIREGCQALDLPLETLVKELAPGQYEVNLRHVGNALEAADNAQTMKRLVKGVARRHGYLATFMPKPFPEQDGNGFHVHVSVVDGAGHNIFDDGTELGSAALKQAVAGLIETMPELMLLFAPHRNSYRRFASGTHVAHAPTWAYEDRYVALRVPVGAPEARRVEHRVAGSDANPYLVVAGILAGILHGLEKKLSPPAPAGSGTDVAATSLPDDWLTATRAFEASDLAVEYLGAPFKEAMLAVKQHEQDEFARTVTRLEYDTYLVVA
ncbi:MAG: glutamine synthetase family protein [Pseudomonadales bacterium]|jgi:glutamine synthetase